MYMQAPLLMLLLVQYDGNEILSASGTERCLTFGKEHDDESVDNVAITMPERRHMIVYVGKRMIKVDDCGIVRQSKH